MPSASPSPGKRPSMNERSLSTHSLSSSGKPAAGQKQARPHYVSRHSRNVSHGKALNKMGKVNSMANVYAEGRNHQRKRSGPVTPSASPKLNTAAHMKRNSSHVVLPKNTSHGNLRKNQSANTLSALNRNLSHGALKKLGAPPAQKAREQESNKQGVFDLGNASSEDEEEEEWEDSTTQSPELTRNNSKVNSKVSTPARVRTPPGEPIRQPSGVQPLVPDKTSSPPEPSLKTNNRSAPNLRASETPHDPPTDPALLYQNGRASRAPPAVSVASAVGNAGQMPRNDSMRSLQASREKALTPSSAVKTPASAATPNAGQSSSGSVGVSQFLPSVANSLQSKNREDSGDDDDASDFMSNYKPQVSESPERPRTMLNKARGPTIPSRTQQKLELQRREAMRGSGASTATTPTTGMSIGSTISLHSRSGSKGRTRSMAGEVRATKQDYETAIKQLTVVRRFRNPVLESLQRLKAAEVLPNNIGTAGSTIATKQARPPSRRGQHPNNSASNSTRNTTAAGSPEDRKSVDGSAPASNKTRGSGRVQFQLSRPGSHDDMLTTSQGSPDPQHDENDGASSEDALIRRMWESRIDVS